MTVANRQIKKVESSKNKSKTYAAIMAKYKSAITNGYYGEAELIVYAYIEDRLRSFIYYSNGLISNDSNELNADMRELCGITGSISSISTKLSIIKKVIKKCNNDAELVNNEFLKSLAIIYEYAFDKKEFISLLNKIDKWRKYRNEIVHALLNKDLDDLHMTFKAHVEEGYALGRKLDNIVNSLKRV